MKCPIHGDNCPGDDGGFFMDGNHPDDMFGLYTMEKKEYKKIEVLMTVSEDTPSPDAGKDSRPWPYKVKE